MQKTVHAAIAAAILVCLFILVGAFPAAADEDHGPPPAVGATLVPSDRLICKYGAALDYIFEGGKELAIVLQRTRTAKLTPVAGNLPLCALGQFPADRPVTVVSSHRVGSVVLTDNSEMAAWAVEIRFGLGAAFWMLWLELLPPET